MLLTTSVPVSIPLVPAIIAGFYYSNENFSDDKENLNDFEF